MTYRITFTNEGKVYQVLSNELDTNFHPYLIRIAKITFEDRSSIIVSASGDDARKRFGGVEEILVPMQEVKLIELIPTQAEKVTTLRRVEN